MSFADKIRWHIILFAFALLSSTVSAQEKKESENPFNINIGLKGGFASTIYQVADFRINGVSFSDNIEETSRVGYFGTFFARFNIDRHFVQTEITYNVSKYTLSIDKNGGAKDKGPDYAEYSLTNHAIEIPLMYGYNFVHSGPYKMCFFIGPKAKLILNGLRKQTFSNFDQENIKEDFRPINFSIQAGLGINISRIFFDFSYEVGLHNISSDFTTDNPEDKIRFDRHKNVLSFSLGIIL